MTGFITKMKWKIFLKKLTTALGCHDDMDPFLRDIFPLMMLYRAMARCPFRTNEQGKLEVNLLTINGLYFVFVYGLISFLIVDAHREDAVLDYFRQENFSYTITGISGITLIVLHASVLPQLTNLWESSMNYFSEWERLNVNFKQILGMRKRNRTHKLSAVMAVIILVGSFAVMIPLKSIFFGRYWYHSFMSPVVFISTTTEQSMIMIACLELRNMSSQVNFKLKSNGSKTARELQALRKLWLGVAHLARKTGSCLALSLFLELGCSTAYFSFAAFGGVSCLISGKENPLQYLVVCTIMFIRLFLFFETGEQTTHVVGKEIVETLSTTKVLNMDNSVSEEVDIFIQTIKSNYPTISLGGLTRITRRVLLLFMIQAHLYMIMLIQMQIAAGRN